jgi:hypothetical protein
LDLKHLLKRGALLATSNWQTVVIQFVAETTFQVLLAVPIVGAAVLVAVLLGGDLAEILHGSLRDIFTTIASTLLSEPVALVAFVAAFAVVLLGGSVLMFAVKGGTVDVLVAANAEAGPIEQHPLTVDMLREASRFTLKRFTDGCARNFHSYLILGLDLMVVYAVSSGAYLIFVAYGYHAAEGRAVIIGWTFVAAMSALLLVATLLAGAALAIAASAANAGHSGMQAALPLSALVDTGSQCPCNRDLTGEPGSISLAGPSMPLAVSQQETGGKVTVRITGTNDDGDRVTNGGVAGHGNFTASGAITDKGTVTGYRTVKGALITLRFVTVGTKGTISSYDYEDHVTAQTRKRPVAHQVAAPAPSSASPQPGARCSPR